jgi:hypothetical protein
MYKIIIHNAQYIEKDGCLEWDESIKFESKTVEKHKTVKECFESMNDWGSRWVMYPSVTIENEEGEEVWSSIPACYKCECCKHETWDQIEGGLYTMKNKDGSKLFPEII